MFSLIETKLHQFSRFVFIVNTTLTSHFQIQFSFKDFGLAKQKQTRKKIYQGQKGHGL